MKEKVKIEIKNRYIGSILFEYECEENTIKKTVEEAVKNDADIRGADLRGADLGGADLRGADLGCADLRGAYIRGADLRGADLGCADLRGAYLGCADLRGADLRGADLRGAYLRGADLRGADLRGADLRGAYLGDADLGCADLGCADLSCADLSCAKNLPFVPMTCPSDGSFIGWKKVNDGGYTFLVKLLILDDSLRSSATGRKCRCDKAKVLQVIDLDEPKREVMECTNVSYAKTVYKTGEIVKADKWDDNRWNECSHGIHFFINRQEAEGYNL